MTKNTLPDAFGILVAERAPLWLMGLLALPLLLPVERPALPPIALQPCL